MFRPFQGGTRLASHGRNFVVLKGAFGLATGDAYDPAALHELPTGSYGFMPKRVHHFGVCKGESLLVVYGIGPFKVNWISASKRSPKKPAAK